MKTRILTLLLSLMITISGFTQTHFGVEVGPNFSKIKSDYSWKSKPGFLIGGHLVKKISKKLSFRPEFIYVQKGGKFEDSFSNAKLTAGYFEMPMNIVTSLYAGKGKLYFGGGPSLAYLISGKFSSIYFDGFGQQITYSDKFTDNKLRIGWGLLLGYQLKSGLNVNAQFNRSTNTFNNSNFSKLVFSDFSIRFAYTFN